MGPFSQDQSDPGYTAILEWADAHGPNTNIPKNRGFDFFAKRVQPMLVKKGCMAIGCHSPAMFHDYRLRGGSGGNFSVPTSTTNYELTREQLALETPDPSASRLIAKNLLRPDQQPGGRGILHRGGALFDDFTGSLATSQVCNFTAAESGPLDDQHAYCVIARWIQIEREDAKLTPLSGMVYVRRRPLAPPDPPQDFARYGGSSDLCFSTLSMDAMTGAISGPAGACRSLLAGCAGLSPATADIRHPSVSWKGDRVAFAARNSEGEPFAIYTVNVDGSACQRAAPSPPRPRQPAGPTTAPRPQLRSGVHARRSHRLRFDARQRNEHRGVHGRGPTRTPADPSRYNANPASSKGRARAPADLPVNQELYPDDG